MPNVIYFIQADEGGPVKIGLTSKTVVNSRLASFQTGNPWPLRMRGEAEGRFREEEQAMHERFDPYRLREATEWFWPAAEMHEFAPDLILDAPPKQWLSGAAIARLLSDSYNRGFAAGRWSGISDGEHAEQLRIADSLAQALNLTFLDEEGERQSREAAARVRVEVDGRLRQTRASGGVSHGHP